ncbi:hypothetical protein AB0E25_33130 [Streptomyces bobili]|uniref:hypothetical protein n=1 Tax=Streptomyces bobili TaxID=67280 RepID=UPI0033D5B70F
MSATPAEWVSAGSAGLSAVSLIGLAMAFVDADAEYFDPRPAVVRAVAAGRFDPLLIRVANARFDVREMAAETRAFLALSLRENAVTVAALLMLLTASEATR